ncbi:MAG: O-antigen ligase family protein, partial [Candidatus Sumerlaeota bacterium]|nr:O-antigen ligase family protein [Candidatus Sumerlaeota bacterium]
MKPNPSNNSNTRAHAPKTATAPAAAMSPGAAPVSIRLAKDDGGFLWLPVMLTALVVLPHVMACTYLPKTAWASFAVAVGLAWRRPAGPVWFRLTPLGAVWLAYISWALISLIWAPQPRLGLERWFELLLPTCAYLLARRIRFWESDRFWTCFYVLAGLVAMIGLLQAFFSNLPLLQNIPGTKSPQTTEGQRNFASMFFLVCVPLFGWRYYVARDMRAALWPLAALLLSLAFIAVAGARGAWMGLAAAMAFLFATGIWRMAMRERNKTLLLSCLAGAGVVIALAFLARHPSRQFLETQAFQKRNIQETTKNLFTDYWRLDMWSKSLAMTHPLTGAGFGNFPVFATVRFRDAPVVDLNWEVHNDYIQAYLDLGVVGAFLHLLFFLMVIRLAWR